jgi:hypothetical protein
VGGGVGIGGAYGIGGAGGGVFVGVFVAVIEFKNISESAAVETYLFTDRLFRHMYTTTIVATRSSAKAISMATFFLTVLLLLDFCDEMFEPEFCDVDPLPLVFMLSGAVKEVSGVTVPLATSGVSVLIEVSGLLSAETPSMASAPEKLELVLF